MRRALTPPEPGLACPLAGMRRTSRGQPSRFLQTAAGRPRQSNVLAKRGGR